MSRKEYQKKWKQDNRDQYLATLKEWREANKEKIIKDRRSRYERDKEKIKAANRENYHRRKAKAPEEIMLKSAEGRARRNGLDFNLDISDIVVPDVCPILGIEIKISKGRVSASSPVLDRKDNSKGYVKGNVAVISSRANMLKSDMSPEQIKRLLEYVS